MNGAFFGRKPFETLKHRFTGRLGTLSRNIATSQDRGDENTLDVFRLTIRIDLHICSIPVSDQVMTLT